MNTNFFHNLLNLVLLLIGTLMTFDWTVFGLSAQAVGMVVAALSFLKLLINAFRDGTSGMTKPQPPVQK